MADGQKSTWTFLSRLLIIGFSLLLVAWILILFLGPIEGREISPLTFEQRWYEYYRIPGTQLQLTPVKYTPIRNSLVAFLQAEGYLSSQPPTGQRWDVVVHQGADSTPFRGRAWVLATLLATTNDEGLPWQDWSKEHPHESSCVWRQVARAAQDGLYFAIPELCRRAQGDPRDLESDLLRIMQVAYQQQIAYENQSGNAQRAARLAASLESLTQPAQPPEP